MRKLFIVFFYLVFCSEGAYCQNTVINFDDVIGNQAGNPAPTPIANGYHGFDWVNLYIANATSFPQSGILNGMVSGPNVAGSPGYSPGASPIISSFSAATPFILLSGYFTSAFLNGMSLEITGLDGTTKVFDETFTLNVTGPSFLTLPASAVTEVDFLPTGGSLAGPGYLGGGPEVVMDNLTVSAVPEPSTWALMAGGAGLLAVFCQLRK